MKIYITAFFGLFTIGLFAQQVPSKSEIPLPVVFKKYWHQNDYSKVLDMSAENLKGSDSRRLWYVVCKEDNTIAVKSPVNNTETATIPFLQSLIVINKKGDMIEVVDGSAADGGMKLNSSAKYYGWIPMSKIIPSAYAPKDSKNNQLCQKAMCILNIDGEIMKTSDVGTKYSVYKNSSGNNKSNDEAQANYIYYVFDRVGTSKNGRSLLAKNSKITVKNNYTLKTEILGWVDNNYVQVFNTRICYEPNWNPESNREYQGVKLGAYKTRDYASRFNSSCSDRTDVMVTMPRNLNGRRMNAGIQRLVQMEPPKNNVVKVGAIGKLQGSNTNSDISQLTKQRFEDDMRKFGKLNVLFVMDGTSSMKNYRRSVAKAIITSINNIKNELDGGVVNELKFGVSVYRDYADGDKKYESIPLTTNHTRVSNWVNTISCMSRDQDYPEAVFQGLEKSIKSLNEDEKNLVIWIGDCGNHKNDSRTINESQIGRLASQKNVSWVVFQVNKGSDPSYMDFALQTTKIVRNTAQSFLSKTKLNTEYSSNFIRQGLEHSPFETKLDLMKEYPKDAIKSEDATLYSKTRTAKKGIPMDPIQLEKEIVLAVSSMYQQHRDNMMMLKKVNSILGNVKDINGLNPDLLATFRSLGYTDQDIKNLAQKEFRFESYLPLKCNSNYERAYREVVFISDNELNSLKELLKQVMSANNRADARQTLYETLLSEMKKLFGESDKRSAKAAEQVIKQMTLNEIWMGLFGIRFTGENGEYRLAEIKREDKFDNNWIENFSEEVAQSYDNLVNIDRSYEIQKQINNETFYYIEREFFPGAR